MIEMGGMRRMGEMDGTGGMDGRMEEKLGEVRRMKKRKGGMID